MNGVYAVIMIILSSAEYKGTVEQLSLLLSCRLVCIHEAYIFPQALDLLFSRMIHQQSLAHCLTNSLRFSCQFFTIPGNKIRVSTHFVRQMPSNTKTIYVPDTKLTG